MKTSTWVTLAVLLVGGASAFYFFQNKNKQDNLKFLRNNWSSYIATGRSEYRYSALGGIEPFAIPVQNSTNSIVDEVDVSIDYIKTGGGIFKTERVQVSNIPPHATKTVNAPSSPRGTSINLKIASVVCKDLNLCFPNTSAPYDDPYLCH